MQSSFAILSSKIINRFSRRHLLAESYMKIRCELYRFYWKQGSFYPDNPLCLDFILDDLLFFNIAGNKSGKTAKKKGRQ